MDIVERYDEVPIDDIVADRFQVRTENIGVGLDDLAVSIEKFGLLQPIVLCRSERFAA